MTQEEAVADVRSDMLELNQHVMDALTKHDISAVSLAASLGEEHGKGVPRDLGVFDGAPTGIVETHGDVVECDPPWTSESCPRRFGLPLGNRGERCQTIGVCDGGVEGVLSEPPTNENDEAKLITVLTRDHPFEGEHMTDMDVTGGIGLKVTRGFQVAEHGVSVHMVSGELDQRVKDACLGSTFRGTTLQP